MKTTIGISKIIFLLIILQNFSARCAVPTDAVHYIEPGKVIVNDKPGLQVFCHKAKSKYLINIWKTITMDLNINLDTYDLYDGKTPQEVFEKHENNQRFWKFNFFGTKKHKLLKINPFETTCIGVYIHEYNGLRYTISMTQTRVDIGKVLMALLGVILFWSAKRLSHNPLFYYLCGISLGVTASLLVLIYFASKLFPRGKFMYLMVATGWSMSFYLGQILWENAQLIVSQYREYVMWYILITSLISFLICYRFGPVTNKRTKQIIQWFLQGLGLLFIYSSSYFYEASFLNCVILVLIYNFPIATVYKGKQYWKKMFPERRKLLTDNEYRKEGIQETKKALKDLQQYCSSPECNPWKTVLKLKDPIRFAKFIEGDSHLSDKEMKEHDLEITRIVEEYEYTDDDDDY
ncbi:nuclear envelope integral membrane protein 1 isoform X1 [Vespula maculifrons]|uniref:Nuclear envelope integral membrane protein 1 isoform X1 n=1 Tax=Vespula maculifrons TaxID=7453 RepID=A0ABD2C9D4_VESMC|nr:nuclear envelope integral membrane protein 1 isoform X1 [Vespula vulgaris]